MTALWRAGLLGVSVSANVRIDSVGSLSVRPLGLATLCIIIIDEFAKLHAAAATTTMAMTAPKRRARLAGFGRRWWRRR